ncbi:ABC transporter ATP-binding protein [Psychrobacillus vulpis]|uniref:ATP-binding cassette domain-containing protein n=1 Tax=Psychrobacillus vulpis TaxID=2325572 RepID=A0A544TNJ2_9BACI|nr:ATP-binding cassette domain-containing protein [Psychrobacillus vulpis]TQR19021.1 ATP-binding cassette domain-containing protein [Psychrobacillus vulpis]
MTTLFELKNITKNYWESNEETSRSFLFANITATLQKPERIALLGKSGQGKSTLLRMLALLDTVDNGDVCFKGVSAKDTDTRIWRMNICYVAQQAVMLPGTIEDNLKTVSKLHNSTFDENFARELMKDVGLSDLDWGKQATDLSGGEKQRVSLVRSLLISPSILLLDEITASLDQQSKEYVEQLLVKFHLEKGTSFIWVTHDTEQAKKISERIWYMEDGTLAIDSKTEVFFENGNDFPSQVMI